MGALVITDTMTQWSEDEVAWAERQVERPGPEFANPAEAGSRYRLSPPETKRPDDWIRHLGEAAVVERKRGVWQYAVDRRVFAHAHPDAWPLLPGVVCPTLVVRGEGSRIMDRDAWLRVATAVQRGQFAEVKDAWHHLILNDPAVFCSIATTWLDRVVAPSPAGGR